MLRFAAMLFVLAPMVCEAQIIITVPVPAPVVPPRFGSPLPPPSSEHGESHESHRRGMFRRWGDRIRARREMHREMAARYGWPTIGVPVPVPVPFSTERRADRSTQPGVDEPQLEIEIPENSEAISPRVEPIVPDSRAPSADPNELPAPIPAPAPQPEPEKAPTPPVPSPSLNSAAPVLPAPPLAPTGPQKF